MVQLSLEDAWKNARARTKRSSTTRSSQDSPSKKNSKENTQVEVEVDKKPVIDTSDALTKDFNSAVNYCMELLQQQDYLLKSSTNQSISRESAMLGQDMYDYMKKIKEKMASEHEDGDMEMIEKPINHPKKVVIKTEEPMEIDGIEVIQSKNKNPSCYQLSDSEDDVPLVTRQNEKSSSKSRITKDNASPVELPEKLEKINEAVVSKCRAQIDKKKILTNELILDWAKDAAKDLQDETFLDDEEESTSWLTKFKELNKITGANTLRFEIDTAQADDS